MEQEFPNTSEINDRSFDIWQDRGFWLVFLLLPLLLASFRKGAVYVLILAPSLLTSAPTEASVWQDLWYTADQQGQNALENGDAEKAQSLFKNQQWQASAAFKNADYDSAAELFKQGDSADDYYNLGNSLAHMGELDKAIAAYDQALQLQPDMQDAIANKKLIEQLKQQQQQKDQNGESQDQSQDSQSQDSQSQDAESQDSQSQDAESQQSESQEGEQQQSKQQEDEQEAESEAVQQDLEQQQDQESAEQQLSEMQKSEQEKLEEQQQQELQQWLRRVPDDPGGLLRQKFRHQSQQRANEQRSPPPPNQQERW
jgi:Ca-activated chloride channel family protein